ncbi:hypothetical protein PHYBOEH_003171 [Phytophthora boehmeriae]|uniref:Protein phosphatase 2C n=1 Tax=Phytophthora boehmeriae TaxID=109152 RepID=A0A8T1WT47_9STRA|nr:hypothetical protein PHYBOEH_003171 [Phytophthora boehmeriae]
MGCVVGKPLLASSPPADVPKDNPSEDAASTPQTLLDSTKGITQDESQPDSQGTALLTLAMGVDTSKVIGETVSVKPGDDDAQLGGDGSSGNVLKSRVHQSILGDPQPEDAPPSMLPDVSYSMRDGPAQSVAINPNDGLNQPTNPVSSLKLLEHPGGHQLPYPEDEEDIRRQLLVDIEYPLNRQRLPFPVVGNAQDSSPSKPLGGGKADNTDSSSDEAEDADDDEDLDDDEEEVEDWDLDDGDEKSKPENPAKLKLDSAKNGHPTPSPSKLPKFGDWLNSRTMINNYIILEQLGAGGYAEVKLCKEKLSGKLFAMKFISRDVMKKDKLGKQSKLDDIKREIAIMKKLNHPNVLRLYEVMDDPKMNKLFLVLEYMKHGDMLSYQKKKHPQGMLENLRDRDLHSVFLQVILGLAYLHEQKIVHGDIKPQNLLVESQITVSKDEIEHAVGANHIVLLMNIRKQMLKSLKRARERLAVRNAAQTQTVSTEWDTSSKLVFAQSPKARNLVKTNKILAANSDPILITDAEKGSTFEDRRVLSNEEIDYRSQLFSRKKPSNKNALEMASGGTGDVSRRGSLSAQAQTIAQVLSDGLDDDDALSDEDDELAVSQSPQLLDELLLTTLSMPPLTKTAGDPVHMPSLFVSRSEAGSNKKPGSSGLLSIGSRSSTSIANVGRSTGSSDDQRFYGKSPALSVHYGVSSLQGRRSTQEDRWVVFPTVSAVLDCGNGPSIPWTTETAYVGIYDGHGGEECANILYDQLHTWIFRSLESSSLSCKDLQECFETLDASVCDYLLHKDDLSGSTATSVVFRKAGDGKLLLTFAHVGDCRLVLSKRDGRTVELTQDHRLTLETERDRVIQLGGRVVNNRVNGVMAITRAFGDLEFKGMLGRHHSTRSSTGSESFGRGFREDEKVPPLLTAKPDVHDVELDANEDAFLILACDGLWDVITSEEAAEILRDRIRLHGDLQLAAHELAQEGIRRYSNDNITVIAMLLQSPELIALHGS